MNDSPQSNDPITVEIAYSDASFQGKFDVLHDGRSDHTILEDVFAQWNGGSGLESSTFINAHCRSLSVGDFVKVGPTWYRCEGCGWKFASQSFVTGWFDELQKRVSASDKQTIIARWTESASMAYELEMGTLVLV